MHVARRLVRGGHHLGRRRDHAHAGTPLRDPASADAVDVGPHEPAQSARAFAESGDIYVFAILAAERGRVVVLLTQRFPRLEAASPRVQQPWQHAASRVRGRDGVATRGVARGVPAATQHLEFRCTSDELAYAVGGDASTRGDVGGDDASQRATRGERAHATVRHRVAAPGNVQRSRRLVHERAERGVVQATLPPRHAEKRVPGVGRQRAKRLTGELDELIDVRGEEVDYEPLQRFDLARHRARSPRGVAASGDASREIRSHINFCCAYFFLEPPRFSNHPRSQCPPRDPVRDGRFRDGGSRFPHRDLHRAVGAGAHRAEHLLARGVCRPRRSHRRRISRRLGNLRRGAAARRARRVPAEVPAAAQRGLRRAGRVAVLAVLLDRALAGAARRGPARGPRGRRRRVSGAVPVRRRWVRRRPRPDGAPRADVRGCLLPRGHRHGRRRRGRSQKHHARFPPQVQRRTLARVPHARRRRDGCARVLHRARRRAPVRHR